MKIYLIRHGKSDKSLKDTLPHEEFELKRPLVEGEEEKARKLGEAIKKELGSASGYDIVNSGRVRSRQTVLAVAKGLGLSQKEATKVMREDFGLAYLADKNYWDACKAAVKSGEYGSIADFFLSNSPVEYFKKNGIENPGQTLTAAYMRQNMRSVLRRAIERDNFLNIDIAIMVSHEPVVSLCITDLTGKSVEQLGGQVLELEYVTLTVTQGNDPLVPKVELEFRNKKYDVTKKIFTK